MLADPRMALRTTSLVQPVPSGLWLLQDSWWVKACASDFFICPHACPHHFRRGTLASKIEQNLGSVPSFRFQSMSCIYCDLSRHPGSVFVIPPLWTCYQLAQQLICYKESIACAHSELFSNPVGIPNWKSAARAEFTPKVREGERISHDSTSSCCD